MVGFTVGEIDGVIDVGSNVGFRDGRLVGKYVVGH